MKILTLNTHSLSEKDGDHKRRIIARYIADNNIDVVTLQEVCQTIDKNSVEPDNLFKGETSSNIKEDNFALALIEDIKALGKKYEWNWIPVKIGYGKYDEGLAILSKYPILSYENILLTKTNDFSFWKKRNALGIQILKDNTPFWVYTTHMGWWNDEDEPFTYQWNRLNNHLHTKRGKILLTGDFNAPDDIEGQSYDCVVKSGWFDTFYLSKESYGMATASGQIDGWKDNQVTSMRIDYIFSNLNINVKKHDVVFDGNNEEIVSDHFGVLVEEE